MNKYLQSFIFSLLIFYSAFSSANSDIESFTQKTVDQILEIVTSESMSGDKKSALLERTFLNVVDVRWIAKYTLGRHWSSLSAEEVNEFIKLYEQYLLSIYVPNFKKYNSDKVTITGIQEIGSADRREYLVKTTIENERRTTAYSINFRVIEKNTVFKIFDFITEGVSMISTQRAEFNAIISAHGMPYLFNKLRNRSA
jgi:phospholipid transport system substrate-binding protein